MTTLTFAVRDSATMTRRSLRHVLRYPVTMVVSVAVPVGPKTGDVLLRSFLERV